MCTRSLRLKPGLAHAHKFVITGITETERLCALCARTREKKNTAALLKCCREHSGQSARDRELVTSSQAKKGPINGVLQLKPPLLHTVISVHLHGSWHWQRGGQENEKENLLASNL